MTKSDLEEGCLWCGDVGPLEQLEQVQVVNPQLDLPHLLRRCGACGEHQVDVRWPGRTVRRKVQRYERRFRKPLWIVVYPLECRWCESTNVELYEVNATIANPVSMRFRYDIYRCGYCRRPTAISYLGEINAYRVRQDELYAAMWYLELED
jgi:hypothetical protein